MSYAPPPPEYYTKLQLYTAAKIYSIMDGIMGEKDDKDDMHRTYYKYKYKINGVEKEGDFYFTDIKGEYIDTTSNEKYRNMKPEDQDMRKREREHEETFFNSLLDLKSYYDLYKNNLNENVLVINDTDLVAINKLNNTISSFSPTLLGIADKQITLYDAVYMDVLKEHPYIQPYKKEGIYGGKKISKGKSNKVSKKPVVSQKKQSVYKEILGKQMKIYKMPDSRKEYVKYKGELHPISEYKSLMKQKALAKPKSKK